ncbi:MAG: hypothetical protein VB032_02440 [Burkholderiaceae bacterium]|nr:hypothetical protein [Burkholderiaceae bacterium]
MPTMKVTLIAAAKNSLPAGISADMMQTRTLGNMHQFEKTDLRCIKMVQQEAYGIEAVF